jgi:hypothetical protein
MPPGWQPTASHIPTAPMRRVPRRRPSRTRVRHNTIGALALLLLLAALVLGFLLWRSTQNPNPPHTPPRVAAAGLFCGCDRPDRGAPGGGLVTA